MPAFGLSAVPSPTKNRIRSAIGLAVNDPVAAADGPTSITGSAGSPLDVAAAGATVFTPEESSRRVNPATAHINGPTAGAPPSPSAPSHDSRLEPISETDPAPAATDAAGAVITGTAPSGTAAGVATTGALSTTTATASTAAAGRPTDSATSTTTSGVIAAPPETTAETTPPSASAAPCTPAAKPSPT